MSGLTRDLIRAIAGANETGKYRALPQFSSLGAYTIEYVTKSGESLCANCATLETDYPIPETWNDDPIVAVDIYWEGPVIQCAGCNAEDEGIY